MSALRNYPVILNNKSTAILQNIQFDQTLKRVQALIISCGLAGKRIVTSDNVLSIADSFILIGQHQRYRRSYEQAPCTFVRDTTGLLVGRISDYAIDKHSLAVLAVEFNCGYLPAYQRYRLWAFDYARSKNHSDELIVPACIGSELTFEGG